MAWGHRFEFCGAPICNKKEPILHRLFLLYKKEFSILSAVHQEDVEAEMYVDTKHVWLMRLNIETTLSLPAIPAQARSLLLCMVPLRTYRLETVG